MLEGQFYTRLMLNIIVGMMFAYAMVKMAIHNNQESSQRAHKTMRVFSYIFASFACLSLVFCIFTLIKVDFPSKVIGPFISASEIVRPTSAIFHWGYPTMIQNTVLNAILNTFFFLGLAGYLFYFKSSNSSWWKKIVKILTIVLLYAFMASATNFHYFDNPEFIAPILFAIIWLAIMLRKNKQSDQLKFSNTNDVIPPSDNSDSDKVSGNDDKGETIGAEVIKNIAPIYRSVDTNVESSDTITSIAATTLEPAQMYCRHCGKMIDEMSLYCKYCGGKLEESISTKNEAPNQQITDIGSKSTILFSRLRILKSRWEATRLKKILKWSIISILSLAFAMGIGSGIWYYIDEVRPQKEAERILADGMLELNNLKGDELFVKCNNIIRYHTIPKCGKEWRDRNNLNELTSLAWAKISILAENGNSDAQFMLGVRYGGYDFESEKWNYNTEGWRRNPYYDMEKAAYWYLQAAQQGNPTAQNNLGNCYENGNGVKKNVEEAVKWFRLSAASGNDYGQLNLGDCFRDGHKKYIGEHWEKDTDAGYYSWAYKLGYHKVSDYSIVIEQNLDSAKYYWQLSAAQGNETAKERLQKIY